MKYGYNQDYDKSQIYDLDGCPHCGFTNSIEEYVEDVKRYESVEYKIGVGLNTRTIRRELIKEYKAICRACKKEMWVYHALIKGIEGWTSDKYMRSWGFEKEEEVYYGH